MASKKSSRLSRRRVLKTTGAAVLGGGAAILGSSPVAAQGGAPAVLTNAQGGRRFQAFVKYNAANPAELMDLTVLPITGRQMVIRQEAAQTCYTNVDTVLVPGTNINRPTIMGHGGVGIVEAIGPQVLSCRVGDRVVVNLHDACGRCFNCLNMRSDKCVQGRDAVPTCTMADGTQVYSPTSGMAELLIVNEDYATPLFTDVSPAEISMLTCVSGCGLGMTMTNCPVEVASDVVIFGAGPVGLAAVMGAKVKGASRIIAVEPIAYRRDLALKLGATDVVDPNQYTGREPISNPSANGDRFRDDLVMHLREMTRERNDRLWAGMGRNGPHHVIEAVGGDRLTPVEVQGPDPTGITVLNQCWELGSSIGTIVTCSVGQPRDGFVSLPASQWADGAKHHWPGTGGGTNDRRDAPRHVRLMETGQIDMAASVGRTHPLSQSRQAYQECADRTIISTVVTANT